MGDVAQWLESWNSNPKTLGSIAWRGRVKDCEFFCPSESTGAAAGVKKAQGHTHGETEPDRQGVGDCQISVICFRNYSFVRD